MLLSLATTAAHALVGPEVRDSILRLQSSDIIVETIILNSNHVLVVLNCLISKSSAFMVDNSFYAIDATSDLLARHPPITVYGCCKLSIRANKSSRFITMAIFCSLWRRIR